MSTRATRASLVAGLCAVGLCAVGLLSACERPGATPRKGGAARSPEGKSGEIWLEPNERSTAGLQPDSPYVKVLVSRRGVVTLDGRTCTLEELNDALSELARLRGVVLYAREAPDEEPHRNAKRVLETVIANRLPVRLCTRLDFSDALDPDGKLRLAD